MKFYPKIRTLGHKETLGILSGPVVVQEKIDGSNFCFGKTIEGELFALSRSQELSFRAPEKIFQPALEHVKEHESMIPSGMRFYCETLSKPKHNVIAYNKIPDGNIVIYEVIYSYLMLGSEVEDQLPDKVALYAKMLGVTPVPECPIEDGRRAPTMVEQFLETWSPVLGGEHVEGCVIKNFNRFGADGGILRAKVVRSEYREQHQRKALSAKDTGGSINGIGRELGGPMRWSKAMLRLREQGKLEGKESDIGPLFAQVKLDILDECGPEAGALLWEMFQRQILQVATQGLADWYKGQLNEEAS